MSQFSFVCSSSLDYVDESDFGHLVQPIDLLVWIVVLRVQLANLAHLIVIELPITLALGCAGFVRIDAGFAVEMHIRSGVELIHLVV